MPADATGMLLDERSPRSEHDVRLVDLWAIVVRRKLVIAASVLVSMALGLIHVFSTPLVYEYTTIVEVGARYIVGKTDLGGRLEPVEPIETVRAKVEGGYITQVLREHIKTTNDTGSYEIKAEVPKSSHVLLLRSKGPVESEATYAALHEAIVDRIKRDHLQVQQALRGDLEARLELQQRGLSELRRQAKLFNAQLTRLEGKAELPARELSYLTSLRLSDNQRAQTEIIVLIDNVRGQLANTRETRTVVSPMRSLQSVGPGRGVILILAALVGLVLGLVVALFVDFMANAHQSARVTTAG